MKNNSWKTTLAGLAAGALNLYANGVAGKQIAVSAALVLLGKLSQDESKQTPETK